MSARSITISKAYPKAYPNGSAAARRLQNRRQALSFLAPGSLLLMGTLSACGKKGDLEPPPPAAQPEADLTPPATKKENNG